MLSKSKIDEMGQKLDDKATLEIEPVEEIADPNAIKEQSKKLLDDFDSGQRLKERLHRRNRLTKINPKFNKFKSSVIEIITLVADGEPVEGVDLIAELQDPDYSFSTTKDPLEGEKLYKAFSKLIKESRAKSGRLGAIGSKEKRNQKADEYATDMYSVIEKMKSEAGAVTFKATVDLLNKKEIPTPNGGKWRNNTLQSLQKRWKNLGLISDF